MAAGTPEYKEREARRAEKAAAFELERRGSRLRTRDVLWALSWLVAVAWRALLWIDGVWIDGAQARSEFWSSSALLLVALDLYIAAYAAWTATMSGLGDHGWVFFQGFFGWRRGSQARDGGAGERIISPRESWHWTR